MKAVAFANNDIAVVAWTFGGKLPNCLGFAIYRVDVRAGTETCLPRDGYVSRAGCLETGSHHGR